MSSNALYAVENYLKQGNFPSQFELDKRSYEVIHEAAANDLEAFMQHDTERAKKNSFLRYLQNIFTFGPAYEDPMYDFFRKHLPKILSYLGESIDEELMNLAGALNQLGGIQSDQENVSRAFKALDALRTRLKQIVMSKGVSEEEIAQSPDFLLIDRVIDLFDEYFSVTEL